MSKTGIPWCEESWNPLTGCTPCSPGCDNCWSRDLHTKRHKAASADCPKCNGFGVVCSACCDTGKKWYNAPKQYLKPFSEIQRLSDRLDEPLHWRKPRTVGVCLTSDLFHEAVPFEWIARVWEEMIHESQHTYLVLTKRVGRMLDFVRWAEGVDSVIYERATRHIWLGLTICNQAEANEKRPVFCRIPGQFLSIEPMLGPIDLNLDGIDAVILGGESGTNARPMHPDWVRKVRDDCAAAGVAFYFKQWGEWRPYAVEEIQGSGESAYVEKKTGHHYHHFELKHQLISQIVDPRYNWKHPVVRCGTRAAGRLLDGQLHDALPWSTKSATSTPEAK